MSNIKAGLIGVVRATILELYCYLSSECVVCQKSESQRVIISWNKCSIKSDSHTYFTSFWGSKMQIKVGVQYEIDMDV